MGSGKISYRQIFRPVFVLFSLYLLHDAFYRWDGFSYYASLSEFLPAAALVTILWTVAALFVSLLIWMPLRGLQWFCRQREWTAGMNRLLMFISVFILLGAVSWKAKRLIWPLEQTTLQLKFMVLLFPASLSLFLTWRFHNKFGCWMEIIQQRITPLVWLFGIWFVFSLPLVAYHTWVKQTDKAVVRKISRSAAKDRKPPNIILVTFDTLTARDMSVYGYKRPTTPFISKWAKTASLFTMVQAESNFTTSTVASLMTGKRVWTHQTYHIQGSVPLKGSVENLPLLLKNNGYHTMALIQNINASAGILGLAGSFNMAPPASIFTNPVSPAGKINQLLYRLFGGRIRLYDWLIQENFIFFHIANVFSQDFSGTAVPPAKVFNSFFDIINDNPPEPFFAWIHLLPPHSPYLPPEPFMGTFDSSPEMSSYKSQKRALLLGRSRPDPAVFHTLRARYDEFIKYCDNQFKDFITKLSLSGKLKNTVIILSSDHGESFEHDYLTHGGPPLYEQVTHIPLIIREPGQTKGQIINNLAEQIDITSTISDLAGIRPPSWMEGRSLVPLMRGKSLLPGPAFSMNFETSRSRGHRITSGTIAVWEDGYKLIHYLEEKKSLLFNLKKDPDELNNLFDNEPETGGRLLALIKQNLRQANERISNEN